MRKNIIVGLVFVIVLSGCYSKYLYNRKITSRVVKDEYATTLFLDKSSKSDYIRIDKVVNSNSFCAHAIAEQYVNHRLVYRLYYGCTIHKTRKDLFSYCSRGSVIGPHSFDGTEEEGTDYESRLNATDKFVLHKIDSFILAEREGPDRFKLCRSTIEGFKRVVYDSTIFRDKL